MTQEWVLLHNGAVTLNATLYMPLGIKHPPVVASAGGAGATTRDGVLLRTRELVRAGLGVLAYDKRGTGDSSGHWNASIEDLASDLRVALDYLAHRGDVDRSRIGVHGHSQGGWVAEQVLAARRRRRSPC